MQVILKGNEFQIVEMFKEIGKELNQQYLEKAKNDQQELLAYYYKRVEELEAQLLKAKETKEHAHLEAMKDVVRKGKAWAKQWPDGPPEFVTRLLYLAIGNCPDVD